jgi:acetone carboxylase gamma subunit
MFAITIFDDIQRHKTDCSCGNCDQDGHRSFGVAIIRVEENEEEAIREAISNSSVRDPEERVYAASPSEARLRAKTRTQELGFTFIGDI